MAVASSRSRRRRSCSPRRPPRRPLGSRSRSTCARSAIGETGWFGLPGARRPRRRPAAGDRRAVVPDIRLRRPRAAARHRLGDGGPRLRAERRGGPGRRRHAGDRGRRQRGDRRRPTRSGRAGCRSSRDGPRPRAAAASARRRAASRPATCDGDGRVEVVATTTNTSPTGSQVFAFDAAGRVVPGWPRYTAADTRLRRLRRLRRERRHRPARRRRATRGRRDVRQPPDRAVRARRHVGARVAVVPRPAVGRAARLGADHPLAAAEAWSRPLPPATSATGRTCARRRGCSGRPRRRRSPTSTATAHAR